MYDTLPMTQWISVQYTQAHIIFKELQNQIQYRIRKGRTKVTRKRHFHSVT